MKGWTSLPTQLVWVKCLNSLFKMFSWNSSCEVWVSTLAILCCTDKCIIFSVIEKMVRKIAKPDTQVKYDLFGYHICVGIQRDLICRPLNLKRTLFIFLDWFLPCGCCCVSILFLPVENHHDSDRCQQQHYGNLLCWSIFLAFFAYMSFNCSDLDR